MDVNRHREVGSIRETSRAKARAWLEGAKDLCIQQAFLSTYLYAKHRGCCRDLGDKPVPSQGEQLSPVVVFQAL